MLVMTNMVDLLANMKGRATNGMMVCRGCKEKGTEENHSHVIECKAYEDLREGLNLEYDSDLVTYYRAVLRKREKKESY